MSISPPTPPIPVTPVDASMGMTPSSTGSALSRWTVPPPTPPIQAARERLAELARMATPAFAQHHPRVMIQSVPARTYGHFGSSRQRAKSSNDTFRRRSHRQRALRPTPKVDTARCQRSSEPPTPTPLSPIVLSQRRPETPAINVAPQSWTPTTDSDSMRRRPSPRVLWQLGRSHPMLIAWASQAAEATPQRVQQQRMILALQERWSKQAGWGAPM